jgi:hypothetical protein
MAATMASMHALELRPLLAHVDSKSGLGATLVFGSLNPDDELLAIAMAGTMAAVAMERIALVARIWLAFTPTVSAIWLRHSLGH